MTDEFVTPRVRMLAVCDEVQEHPDEANVCDLIGVRQQVFADRLPYPRTLQVYLLLSCPRNGSFQGEVWVWNDQSDKPILCRHFDVDFATPDEFVPVVVPMPCRFAQEGEYTIRVIFVLPALDQVDKIKHEQPFYVLGSGQ